MIMLKIYSTFSKDIILDENRNRIVIRKGGPAFFIEKVFRKHKVRYEMNSGNVLKVEIVLTKEGEKGKVKGEIKESKEIQNINNNDFVLISTICGEWVLGDNILSGAKIFLDIQGYIRTKKKVDDFLNNDFWDKVFCIKGTEEEINKLPEKIIKNQKKKCLVITKGKNGSVIYFKNKKYAFCPKRINSKDTIGAGDIFFANFFLKFMETNDIIKSGTFATKETENFLITKTLNKNYE